MAEKHEGGGDWEARLPEVRGENLRGDQRQEGMGSRHLETRAEKTDSRGEQTFEAAARGVRVTGETARKERAWKWVPDPREEQNPEGEKLRSVAGAKQTRQADEGVLTDRLVGSVETLGTGSDGDMASPVDQTFVCCKR